MLQVLTFVFNPFQENTYLLFDETGECAIVDPGMLFDNERNELVAAIQSNGLKPVKLLQTHLHLDHVFGTRFACEKFNLVPEAHAYDEFFIAQSKEYALQFGFNIDSNPPPIGKYLVAGDVVKFGNVSLMVIHVPGHSPGSILFYDVNSKVLIAGDVLFQGSVGRGDLPKGDHNLLIKGINEKLMVLSDDVEVYPGHGPRTTIGRERATNPFL